MQTLLITILIVCALLPSSTLAVMGNYVDFNATATLTNRPFEIHHVFAKDELCDYPRPYVNDSTKSTWQSNVVSRWQASSKCASGSVRVAYIMFHHDVTSGTRYRIDFRNSTTMCSAGDGSESTCLNAGYDESGMLARSWEVIMQVTAWPTSSTATTQTINARTMMTAGKWAYRYIRGPVATQVIVEDRSTSRAYDFGWRETRAARLTSNLLSGATSFTVAADWSAITRPFKVQFPYELVSICFVSYDAGTKLSTMYVGTTNGANSGCATSAGRDITGGGSGSNQYATGFHNIVRLHNPNLTHVGGISGPSSTSFEVSNVAGITNVTLLKAQGELLRICSSAASVLYVGTAAWPCDATSVDGRNWLGTRNIGKSSSDNDNTGYTSGFSFDNWSLLTDVWTNAEQDRYKSLHPVFVLTFFNDWAATGIEYHLTDTWTDRLQDQYYSVVLKRSGDVTVSTMNQVVHKAMTMWKYPDGPVVGTYGTNLGERRVWDGVAPTAGWYDHNLPYLRYTGVIPYDPSVQLSQYAIDTLRYSENRSHSIGTTYAWENGDKGAIPVAANWANTNTRMNCAFLTKNIPGEGGRGDIAPLQLWFATALYAPRFAGTLTGASEWEMPTYGAAACGGYLPFHLWESDTDTNLKFCYDTSQPVGYRSCSGSNTSIAAFGYPYSVDARTDKNIIFATGDDTGYQYQGNQSWNNYVVTNGPSHWAPQCWAAWLLTGDWYYEQCNRDEANWMMFMANSTATTRKGSWVWPGATNGSRPISWYLRTIGLAMWAEPWTPSSASPYYELYLNKLKTWVAVNEGRYNITDGSFYEACADPNDTSSTKWCWGRRTVERDSPTTESSVAWFAKFCCWWVPSPDQGHALTGYAQKTQSSWMDSLGIVSMGWIINMGFADFAKPIMDRVYLRDRVDRLTSPLLPSIINNGEYRDPGTPCTPEGTPVLPDCLYQNTELLGDGSRPLQAGYPATYSSWANWWNSWNSTAKAKITPDNDGDEQSGYWTIFYASVQFSERVRPTHLTQSGHKAIDKVNYITRYRKGRTTGTPMWTFSPQKLHRINIRVTPRGSGNAYVSFRAPNGGPCSYIVGSNWPASTMDTNDTVIPAGSLARSFALTGQAAGTRYLRVTCGESARGEISYTQD